LVERAFGLGPCALTDASLRPPRQNLGREFQGERVGAAVLQGVRFRPADVWRPSPPDATLFRSISDDHVRAGVHFGYS
jgi:hypothetical protein